MPQICRCLSVYERQGDSLLEEYKLMGFNPIQFGTEFDVDISSDPEMIYAYVVQPEHVSYLRRFLQDEVMFDFDCYEYCLEAFTD